MRAHEGVTIEVLSVLLQPRLVLIMYPVDEHSYRRKNPIKGTNAVQNEST